MTNQSEAQDTTLTALDRCDACGAQAYVRVQVGDSGQLLFCAHHARKHAPVLKQVAQIIEDESDRLSQPVGNRD
ncbi:DUF7455 domain-containing protein [Boudabousia marimammalium]|uniref:DUF7455 domain-containing protein n=1 Tax=Boudabousia marimammalium TaxID=156892 RepID=A0A1Q5PRA9_9ACTO|nr:hypothetical protein [Boudabousia marimammalium]OKL49940.1 hypothetical protein BM477_03280 [Boudabousia marimammalium]